MRLFALLEKVNKLEYREGSNKAKDIRKIILCVPFLFLFHMILNVFIHFYGLCLCPLDTVIVDFLPVVTIF